MYGGIYDQIDQAMEKIRGGQVNEGLSILQFLMGEAEGQPDLQLILADVFYDLGHADTARALLEELQDYFDELTTDMQIEARTLKAEIMIDLGELDEAMEELFSCIDLEPDYTRASLLLADIYLMQDLPEIACRHLENILDLESDQEDVRLILSDLYLQLGELEKAQAHLDQLIGTELEGQVRLVQARLWSQMGNFEDAYRQFLQCWTTDPSPDALFGLSATALQLHQTEEAIEYAEELLQLDASHVGAYQVQAEAFLRLDRQDEARQALMKALDLQDQDEAILLKLVEIHYAQGELDAARKYVQQLLSANEEHEVALEWQGKLN
ncbi:tetratricopeptide repeat protein [Ammoniphilus sp. YIM 78166]|uniref:tetratricopeptide repeat protein n=1 Tax=Ammoniphilus sp. YIM 78166 TaxID=1644106 RepID=UPI00142F7506|nr:tetratricopeptide repeat protein [Ammoniphilus sp. YIM 78166]